MIKLRIDKWTRLQFVCCVKETLENCFPTSNSITNVLRIRYNVEDVKVVESSEQSEQMDLIFDEQDESKCWMNGLCFSIFFVLVVRLILIYTHRVNTLILATIIHLFHLNGERE